MSNNVCMNVLISIFAGFVVTIFDILMIYHTLHVWSISMIVFIIIGVASGISTFLHLCDIVIVE